MNEQMGFKNNCKINYMFKINKSSYLKKQYSNACHF